MANNRFSEMLAELRSEDSPPPAPKKRKGVVDFGAAVASSAKLNESILALVREPAGPSDQPEVKTGHLTSHSTGHSTSHPARQPATQPDTQPDSRTLGQPASQPLNRTPDQPSNQTIKQPHNQPPTQTVNRTLNQPLGKAGFSDPVYCLTRNQAAVLYFLIQQEGITQRKLIPEVTGVALGTAKEALSHLVTKGFISKPKSYINGHFRGIFYETLQPLCDEFISRRGEEFQPLDQTHNQPLGRTLDQPSNQTFDRTINRTHNQTATRPDTQVPSSSSSSKDFKKLTTDDCGKLGCLTDTLADDPELEWWQKRGLTVKQVESWMKTAKASEASIIQSLRHFAYDMGDKGREAEMQNPENYFFSVIRKAGAYPVPSGYKSRMQRLIEQEQELLAQQQAEVQCLIDIRQKRAEMSAELEFQQILSDSSTAAYQELLAGLNDFERGSTAKQKEIGLRRVFDAAREA